MMSESMLLMSRKLTHAILVGVALMFVACTGQNDPAPVDPAVLDDIKPKKEGKKQPKPGKKTTTPTVAEETYTSQYTYTGPRMPGLRVSHVSVPGNYVALTFDDGPSPALTPRVLDILNRYGAKGTFFVVGRSVSRNSNILARAVAEGHEVGAHTWSHIKMTASGTQRVISEMDRTNAAILSATGVMPKIMRPPYGAVNSHLVSLMKSRYGMSTIMWDVDTRDWQHPGVSVVTQRAVGRARPGSIILLHDIHESTLHAVEGIVSGLQARGFKIVTVSELMALGRHAAQQAAEAKVAAESASVEATETVQPETPVPAVEMQTPEAQPQPEPVTVPSVTPVQNAPEVQAPENAGAASISGAVAQ